MSNTIVDTCCQVYLIMKFIATSSIQRVCMGVKDHISNVDSDNYQYCWIQKRVSESPQFLLHKNAIESHHFMSRN